MLVIISGSGLDFSQRGSSALAPAHIHGVNGIGDVELPPSSKKVVDENAVDLLIRLARKHPNELTLVTLGRMTNLARALEKEPNLPNLINRVVSMGGTVNHSGNTGPLSEANVMGDPEATDQVLMAGFDMTMVGLDVTMKTRLTGGDLNHLARNCHPTKKAIVDYIIRAMQHYFHFNRVQDGAIDDCPLHDPTAMIIALDPSVASMEKRRARVECQGVYCRGMIVTDKRFKPFDAPYTNFCLGIKSRRVVENLLSVFMA